MPGPLPDFFLAAHSNSSHLRENIGSASAWRRDDPATCKRAANDRDQGSAEEQNANAWDAMTLGSGASGSMAFAGELVSSPKPLPEATTKDSAGSAAAGARIVVRSKTYSMRTLASGTRVVGLLPMLQTYALSCHWVFPHCNRSPYKTWKYPQPHHVSSDRRMTNRFDSGQEKSFKKGPTTRATKKT